MKMLVRKDRMDWYFHCPEHDETVWTEAQPYALEAAYGHLCMYPHLTLTGSD